MVRVGPIGALLWVTATATRAHAYEPAADVPEGPTVHIAAADGVELGPATVVLSCHHFEPLAIECTYTATFDVTTTKWEAGFEVWSTQPALVSAVIDGKERVFCESTPVLSNARATIAGWRVSPLPGPGATLSFRVSGRLRQHRGYERSGFQLRHPLFHSGHQTVRSQF